MRRSSIQTQFTTFNILTGNFELQSPENYFFPKIFNCVLYIILDVVSFYKFFINYLDEGKSGEAWERVFGA